MTAAEPIQRRRLYQDVLDRLLERIRKGEFNPGDQLPSERDLMRHYGVGRPAVREALQALERDAIVTISHGERARVIAPSVSRLIEQIAGGTAHLLATEPGTLDHLKDARLFLETGLARRAAARAGPGAIAALEERFSAHEQAIDEPADFLARDMEFHRAIAAMTGNPIFPALIEAMFGWLRAYYVSLVRLEGAENLTIAEHRRIADAIAAGDPELAGRAMHEHISRANALYRQFEERARDPKKG